MSLSRNKKLALCAAFLLLFDDDKQTEQRKKRVWMQEWLKDKSAFSHANLPRTIRAADAEYKFNLQMDDDSFYELLELIRPKIEKQETILRDAVSAEHRLLATLKFLATGQSYKQLKHDSVISSQLLARIIPETCWAIFNALRNKFFKIPSTQDEWKAVAQQFERTWQVKNCLGAMDAKHVLIRRPINTGAFFRNHEGSFSVVLFAIVNANYEFLYVHTGINGRVCSGKVVEHTDFYTALTSGGLNLPEPVYLEQINSSVPFVFIADDAFRLMRNVMKPYSQKNVTSEQKFFNHKLSRAHRVVENAFEIMANRFKVLLTPIAVHVDNTDGIVLACAALHNFLINKNPSYIRAVDYYDREDGTHVEQTPQAYSDRLLRLKLTRQPTFLAAEKVREKYKQYYNSVNAAESHES